MDVRSVHIVPQGYKKVLIHITPLPKANFPRREDSIALAVTTSLAQGTNPLHAYQVRVSLHAYFIQIEVLLLLTVLYFIAGVAGDTKIEANQASRPTVQDHVS
jgi:hypothetical protein